jgi:hypothetical protein
MAVPDLVACLKEIDGLENACVVDQDINLRDLGEQGGAAFSGGQIRKSGKDVALSAFAFETLGCGSGFLLRSAIHHNVRAGSGELSRNRISDPLR